MFRCRMKAVRNAQTLTDYLFDMIEKVDDDPNFVPQALAASKLANQIISVQKTALMYQNSECPAGSVKFLEDSASEEEIQ